MCEEALARAKTLQRRSAEETHVWIKLALLEDLIDCIEQLQAERPLLAVIAKTRAKKDQDHG